jgi:hypothetical protein
MKFPKNIGACIDQLYELRQKRLKIEKSAKDIDKLEGALEEHIIANFDKTELDGARGRAAQSTVERTTVGTIKDFDLFWPYAKKHPEVMQRRLNNKALRERWDAGKTVPGIEKFTKIKLHTTKVRGKK